MGAEVEVEVVRRQHPLVVAEKHVEVQSRRVREARRSAVDLARGVQLAESGKKLVLVLKVISS